MTLAHETNPDRMAARRRWRGVALGGLGHYALTSLAVIVGVALAGQLVAGRGLPESAAAAAAPAYNAPA